VICENAGYLVGVFVCAGRRGCRFSSRQAPLAPALGLRPGGKL